MNSCNFKGQKYLGNNFDGLPKTIYEQKIHSFGIMCSLAVECFIFCFGDFGRSLIKNCSNKRPSTLIFRSFYSLVSP